MVFVQCGCTEKRIWFGMRLWSYWFEFRGQIALYTYLQLVWKILIQNINSVPTYTQNMSRMCVLGSWRATCFFFYFRDYLLNTLNNFAKINFIHEFGILIFVFCRRSSIILNYDIDAASYLASIKHGFISRLCQINFNTSSLQCFTI